MSTESRIMRPKKNILSRIINYFYNIKKDRLFNRASQDLIGCFMRSTYKQNMAITITKTIMDSEFSTYIFPIKECSIKIRDRVPVLQHGDSGVYLAVSIQDTNIDMTEKKYSLIALDNPNSVQHIGTPSVHHRCFSTPGEVLAIVEEIMNLGAEDIEPVRDYLLSIPIIAFRETPVTKSDIKEELSQWNVRWPSYLPLVRLIDYAIQKRNGRMKLFKEIYGETK